MRNKLITIAALIAILFIFTSCYNAHTPVQAAPVDENIMPASETIVETTTTIKFDKLLHDFDVIPQNQPVHATFNITNTGNEPLIVNSVKPACSCSVGKWPKEPIAPGVSDEISVTFNAKNAGPFTKAFTVVSNAKEGKTIIKIKGTVKSELGKA